MFRTQYHGTIDPYVKEFSVQPPARLERNQVSLPHQPQARIRRVAGIDGGERQQDRDMTHPPTRRRTATIPRPGMATTSKDTAEARAAAPARQPFGMTGPPQVRAKQRQLIPVATVAAPAATAAGQGARQAAEAIRLHASAITESPWPSGAPRGRPGRPPHTCAVWSADAVATRVPYAAIMNVVGRKHPVRRVRSRQSTGRRPSNLQRSTHCGSTTSTFCRARAGLVGRWVSRPTEWDTAFQRRSTGLRTPRGPRLSTCVWDARTGLSLGAPLDHGDSVMAVAWSPEVKSLQLSRKVKKPKIGDFESCARESLNPSRGPRA